MLTRSELLENPAVLTVSARDGPHTVTTERLRGGRIRMTCTCADGARQGWCLHRVRLLCLRYDDVVGSSQDGELRFEEIVTGTPLADAADELELAIADYESARQALAVLPPAFDPATLKDVATRAGDLAEAARLLERSIERLRKRLAGAL